MVFNLESVQSLIPTFIALIFAPLMVGVINRTKSFFGGRRGPPLIQPYYDLIKLLRKGAVYSKTTTWVFRGGPVIALAAIIVATGMVPFAGVKPMFAFEGDIVLITYLLSVARFFTVIAALDTGSSFEGMGASREVLFSSLIEPAMLLGLATIARETESLSLSNAVGQIWTHAGLELALVGVSMVIVILAENSRIPVDDPNTHLELTMIHEVMVLDHGGPDFGYIVYGTALKLWVFGAMVVGVAFPVHTENPFINLGIDMGGMVLLSVMIGVIESTMARLRMPRVPQLLMGAAGLSTLALALVYYRG